MNERKLNIDIPEAAAKFESLIERILPKKIFYKLMLRGKGLEFDGYRDLSSDDDSSLIDWKASARANKLLTKQYVEEREVKILFLVDVSENMVFGSQEKLKCEYCAEMCGALGRVLFNDPRDQLGYVLYNDDIVDMRMPEPGIKQYEAFIHQLSDPNLYKGTSDLSKILPKIIERLNSTISLIIIVSDFLNLYEDCKEDLQNMAGFIETIAIIVKDPLDLKLPNLNREVVIEDPGSGERLLVNPKIASRAYEYNAFIREKRLRKFLRESNVDNVRVVTDKDFGPRVALFLKRRTSRRE